MTQNIDFLLACPLLCRHGVINFTIFHKNKEKVMNKNWSNTALVAYSLLPKIAKELNSGVESRVRSSFQSRHLKIGVSTEQLIGEILDLTEEKRKIVNL